MFIRDHSRASAFPVLYRGKQIGFYSADLVINDQAIVELKAVDGLTNAHRAQVLNYLRASALPIGLLLNFGIPKVQVRRVLNLEKTP